MKATTLTRFALTCAAVLIAVFVAHRLWSSYMYSPWTRDGRVRAEIVRIAPDVAGLVAEVRVVDNQAVNKGDVLFVIDGARFQNARALAEANLSVAQAALRAAEASVGGAAAAAAQSKSSYAMYVDQSKRRQSLNDVISAEERSNSQSQADTALAGWAKAKAALEQANAGKQQAAAAVTQASVAVATAQLNVDRASVRAPVDGFVTNLTVRVGDYAGAGVPRLALIDRHSYWVYGYFEETKLPGIRVGDPVDVRLMSGGPTLRGSVESIARGITDADNPTGADLLANVNPTFNWVRLAQRVPVRVRLDSEHLPAGILLAAGMTATLQVHPSGTEQAQRHL